MVAVPNTTGLHSSEGGIHLADSPGPYAYASELAKYLPADTARVRTIEEFGHAPPIEYIEGQRVMHQERRDSFRRASEELRFVSDGNPNKQPEAIFGPEFQSRCDDMRTGSTALLAAIERERML